MGKTTFIKQLRLIYPNDKILDRGLLSEATLDSEWDRPLKKNETHNIESIVKLDKKTCYILLDTYPEQCQERILKRGDSIDEPYHNMEDLIKFQKRFQMLATSNKQRAIPMFMTYLPFSDNMSRICSYINGFKTNLYNNMEIVVGTTNPNKIREIASILSPLGYELLPKAFYVDETGKDIEEMLK